VTVSAVTICLPTFNERENIEQMLHALAPMDVHVLVIDDNSPDGTGAIADRVAAGLDNVSVLHRERKEGLGPAYIAGFRVALDAGADYVITMDCDFSHDPADVPQLIAGAERGADVVIGSRYVQGGGTRNWGIGRRIVSAGGSFYARTLLGLRIRDMTGGFRCFRRSVLETVGLDTIDTRGYAFQIELTYRATRQGFTVAEVPIVFTDRTAGQSKMTRAIFLEAVRKVPLLRYRALTGQL
jgi:dolichol-phosphate mannosyltransferase